ncbi:MAG: T9SS type A sorting domain-containing protein [bacterium]
MKEIKLLSVVVISMISFLHADSWALNAPMPTSRRMAAAAAVNGKIYVFGGYGYDGSLNVVEEYAPATDSWSTKSPMSNSRHECKAAVVNGKVYVIGGNFGNLNQEYDPITDTWETKASVPTARSGGHAVVAAENGKIYVLGGHESGSYLAVNESYDPITDSWESKTPMPQVRVDLDAGAPGNGNIYAIGAYNDNSNWEYDIADDTWTSKNPMPTSRGRHIVIPLAGKLYAIGGLYYGALDINEEYDPVTDTWTTKTPMLTATYYLTGATPMNGKIYAIGGVPILDVNQEYTPDVVGVLENKIAGFLSTDLIRVSPNPVKDNLVIYLPANFNDDITFSLFDVFGRSIKTINAIIPAQKRQISLSVNELNCGIYFLQVNTKTSSQTLKVIKLK